MKKELSLTLLTALTLTALVVIGCTFYPAITLILVIIALWVYLYFK
jgi:hypothetical protein